VAGWEERHPIEDVLAVVDTVRGIFGLTLLLVAGLAFVVLGHTAGRLVGIGLLALAFGPGVRVARRRFASRSAKRS
jgi:hypothetical protein